ncbi:acyltransferase [Sphingomonas sp. BN140010]|uniref:Acyltransferase n=1 Tax=Sphingomonas arvum TaxID=2992113 RepID=A0ABT3JGI5_9SPHN|nr:acyltransferase [Sphingomonas sp. BN140010]MCW3798198.1 acyltransferase [Sphingomonas sp. BN140010]
MIRPLTSLRFVAALLVVAHHFFGFRAGYAGVSFFFVLSGYVLTINYAGKIGTAEQRRQFWWKRFARIYPLHLLTFVLALPLGVDLVALPFNLTLLQSFVPLGPVYFSFNAPSWSISDEAMFYAVFPLLLAWLRPRPLRRLAWWAATFATVAVGAAVLSPQPLAGEPTHWLFYILPPARLIEFAFGIGLGLLPAARSAGWREEAMALALAAAGLALVYADLPGSLASAMIFWPGAVALVRTFATSRGPLARLLSQGWAVLLGEASFALYMVHFPLLRLELAPPLPTALGAVALSIALHRYFEKPVQRRLLELWSGRGNPNGRWRFGRNSAQDL